MTNQNSSILFLPNLQELKITTANRSRISESKIRESWKKGLEAFKEMRKNDILVQPLKSPQDFQKEI
jgi:hypothetical protein